MTVDPDRVDPSWIRAEFPPARQSIHLSAWIASRRPIATSQDYENWLRFPAMRFTPRRAGTRMSDVALLEIQLAGFPGGPVPGDPTWNCSRGGAEILLRMLEICLRPLSATGLHSSNLGDSGAVLDRSRTDSSDPVPVVQAERKSEAQWIRS
jgi:hypothetical protein